MSTVNDLEVTELLIRIAQLQGVVSAYVRSGHLGMALTKGSELEDVIRRMNWRLLDLKYNPKGTT